MNGVEGRVAVAEVFFHEFPHAGRQNGRLVLQTRAIGEIRPLGQEASAKQSDRHTDQQPCGHARIQARSLACRGHHFR